MTLDIPAQVRETLAQLVDALDERLAEGYSLATYCGLSQRRCPPERRLVKIALIVPDLSEAVLRTLREPMVAALRRSRIDVFMLEYGQLSRVADSFAVKLLEMRTHHEMLRGIDPFTALVISPELVRMRLEQESRNHLMRLRRSFLVAGDSAEALAIAISNAVDYLLGECDAVLSLLGLVSPDEVNPFVALASKHMGLNADILARLVQFRGVGRLDEIQATYFDLLRVAEQVALFVDELEPKV